MKVRTRKLLAVLLTSIFVLFACAALIPAFNSLVANAEFIGYSTGTEITTLYNNSNTYNVDDEKSNGTHIEYNLDVPNGKTVMEEPQITVLTPGLGGTAAHWSNDYPKVQPNYKNIDDTYFAYKEYSLIHQLYLKAGGDAYVYWAKMHENEDAFNLYDIINVDNEIYKTNYSKYEDDLTEITQIEDVSKPIIIVFESSDPEGRNDKVYYEFNYMLSNIVYDVALHNPNNALPKVNLIGHSRGGITNLQYALDHPDLVDKLISLGTPYLGSEESLAFGELVLGKSEGLTDINTLSLTDGYLERWNTDYDRLYSDIDVTAIGAISSASFVSKAASMMVEGTAGRVAIEFIVDRILNTVGGRLWLTRVAGWGTKLYALVNLVWPDIQNYFTYEQLGYVWDILLTHIDGIIKPMWLGDVLVPIDSALGSKDGKIYKGFKGIVGVFDMFDGTDFNKRAVAKAPVPHNLLPLDQRFIDLVLKEISFDDTVVSEFSYTEKQDGTIRIDSYYGIKNSEFVIPSKIDGKTVTEIGTAAFAYAFSEGGITQKVTIPATVTEIGDYAFLNSSGLKQIAFESGSQLKRVGNSAFSGCSGLTSAALPSSVEEIGSMAFADCSSLTGTFTLPAAVTNIYAGAFNGANLSVFTLTASNSNYITENGVLYEKSGSSIGDTLVAYPGGKTDSSFTLPDSVTELGEYAIYKNNNLQSINLSNVETILNCGLSDCEKLTSVIGTKVNHTDGAVLINTPWMENNVNDYVIVGSVLLNYQGSDSILDLSAYSEIKDFAFALNDNIEEVIAGANTEEFGEGAFLGCENLSKIILLNVRHPVYISETTSGNNDSDIIVEVPQIMQNQYVTSYNNSGWDNYSFDFSAIKTNINFESTGGTSCEAVTAYYGSLVELPEPTKAGYDFIGWYDSVNDGVANGNKIDSGIIWLDTTDNVTLYAKWDNANYIVTLDYDDETGQSQSVEVTYLMDMPSISAPTRAGYKFNGFFSEPNGKGVQYYDANMNSTHIWDIPSEGTLYADWVGRTYQITLDKCGGESGSSQVAAIFGEGMPAAAAPVRVGHVFEGYFTGKNGTGDQYYTANMVSMQPWNISSNTTLYAHWSLKEFEVKIQYDSNTNWVEIESGVLGLSSVKVYVPYGASVGDILNSALVTEYKKTEYGYVSGRILSHFELNGQDIRQIWGDFIPDLGNDGAAVVLEPVYNYEVHTINFVTNVNGKTFSSITAQYNASISLPVMTSSDKVGHTFGGWYTSNSFTKRFNYTKMPDLTETYEGNGTITLYAKWSSIAYTVLLDKQNGSGGTSSVSVKFGSAMPSATAPTRAGYTFEGYYTSVGGKGTQYYSSSMKSLRPWNIAVNNYKLYAYWSPNAYRVILNQDGGSGGSTEVYVQYGNAMPNGLTAPELNGYSFKGYYSEPDGNGTQYYNSNMVSIHNWDQASNNVTLYAYWEANQYVIKLNPNGGSGGTSQITVTYGESMPGGKTKPSRTGYTFAGYGTKLHGGTLYYSATMTSNKAWAETDVSVLYAQWTANNYTVTFNRNGGSGGNLSVVATYGQPMPIIDLPTRAGYNFLGYYTSTSGGTCYYEFFDLDAMSIDEYYNYCAKYCDFAFNRTLYARWEEMSWDINVKYYLNGTGYASYEGSDAYPTSLSLTYGQSEIYYALGIKNYDLDRWELRYAYGTIAEGTDSRVNLTNLCKGNYEDYTLTFYYDFNPYRYTTQGVEIYIVNKIGSTWKIHITNNTGQKRDFYYNSKMCFENDAKNWNLSADVVSIPIQNGGSATVSISENAMATSIAICYLDGIYAKVIYAKNLSSNNYTMNVMSNSIDTTATDECIAAGTMITLADGSQVPVESLTGNEMLLVWNMYTGRFDIAPILCIDSDPMSLYDVIQLSFSDCTMVDVISEHGFFDVDLNKYVYLDEHAADYIGHRFLKQGVNGMVQVTLEAVNIVQKSTTAYSPVTYGHLCYLVNGMLSMPGGIDGLFNIFEVDPDTMMYDVVAMAADIEKYGLYTYEELNALVPVPEVMFDAVNGQYLKVAVGKGIITIEHIGKLVERYADLFE